MRYRAKVVNVLDGERAPHELPDDLHALWRDGFHAGAEAVRRRTAVLVDDLNYWYWRAVDPEAHRQRMREIVADFDAQTARNATARRWAALDAAEQEKDHDQSQ